MKRRILMACLLCAVLGFSLSNLSHPRLNGQEPAKALATKWQYKIVHGVVRGTTVAIDIDALNNLGNEGWELFSVIEGGSGCLLKRQNP